MKSVKDLRNRYYERTQKKPTPLILDGSFEGQMMYLKIAIGQISRADVIDDIGKNMLESMEVIDGVINFSAFKNCEEGLTNIFRKNNIELVLYCIKNGLISKEEVSSDIKICNTIGVTKAIPFLVAYGG